MALFGLHTPTFGPLHPIIGKLDGSTGLSGFTNTYIPFGNAAGGLEDSANLTWNGSKLWVYGGGIALETTGSIVANAADLYLKDNASFLWFGDTAGHNPYWYIGHNTGNLNLFSNSTDADYINFGKTTTYSTYTVDSGNFSLVGDLLVNGGDIGITADTDLLQLASGTLTINGNVTSTGTVKGGVVATDNFRNFAGTESIIWNNGDTRWQFSDDVYITGGLTISAFGTAGFVKNTVAGVISGGNTISVGDITDIATNYLKLDCSNDPLTNTLDGANLDFTGTANIDGVGRFGDKVEYGSEYEYDIGEEW